MSRMLSLFSPGARPAASPRFATSSFAEALRILGDGHFAAERFKQARRNYRAALRVEPRNASLWLRYARAWADDPYGSDDRAFPAFRQAVKCDGTSAEALAALGRCALRLHRTELAKKALARAVKYAPADAAVLQVVLESYREAGWQKAAWRVVCQARFLAPKSMAIRQLWERACFDRAVKNTTKESRRATLPFLRIAGNSWRLDSGHAM